MSPIFLAVMLAALVFAFLNGVHDSSNVVATMISSRAFSPRMALATTALANFAGPLIFGVAVADTIGNQIVAADSVSTAVILAALLSAIFWDLATWSLGFPSSSSHALIGGIIGAVAFGAGWGKIRLAGLYKVLIALFTSPVVGFIVALIVFKLIIALSRGATPRDRHRACAESWHK
jgi:PiT family inorganic phosphate transporter